MAVNGFGLLLTGIILCVTVTTKFAEGGWVTLVVTLAFVLSPNDTLPLRPGAGRAQETRRCAAQHPLSAESQRAGAAKSPGAPTAAIIVRDFDGIAMHTLLNIQRLFPNHFKNVVVISVGVIDTGQFKGHQEIERLKKAKEEDLKSFVEFANCLGWYAEYRCALGVDLIAELEEICEAVSKEFPRSVFFSGRLVFEKETLFTRLLHNHTPNTLQQRLQFAGRDMMILPIRVFAGA
jgi:hypothetical protein